MQGAITALCLLLLQHQTASFLLQEIPFRYFRTRKSATKNLIVEADFLSPNLVIATNFRKNFRGCSKFSTRMQKISLSVLDRGKKYIRGTDFSKRRRVCV